jgi:hypothetical protein
MTEKLDVFIDLTKAGLDLEPEELEAYSLQLAEELKQGIAEDAALVRATELPQGSKAGEAGFNLGILKAEINFKNIKTLLNWLGERIYGRTLELEYGDIKLKYRTQQDLEQQLQALERATPLRIQIIKAGTEKD